MGIGLKDACQLGMYLAISISMIILGLFFINTPNSSDAKENYKIIFSSVPSLRMSFVFIYIIFGCGLCIQVFTKNDINYMYVFDLDPNYRMSHMTLYKVAAFFFAIWTTCFAMTIAEMRLLYLFHGAPAYLIYYVLSPFFFIYCC
jgi:hypothetical protein